MAQQPNKPGGDVGDGETPRASEEEQAVRNQGKAKPDDYPDPARLDPEDRAKP